MQGVIAATLLSQSPVSLSDKEVGKLSPLTVYTFKEMLENKRLPYVPLANNMIHVVGPVG